MKEIILVQEDENCLVYVATSFLPPQSKIDGTTGNWSPRAGASLAAATGVLLPD